MNVRLGLITLAAALFLNAQTATESNAAYKRFQDARFTPAGIVAAQEWLQIYERQPSDPKNVPPYLDVARFYARMGIHMDEVPVLLEKALREIDTPGGFTDVFAHTNSPFVDDMDRCLAANVYTQIRQYNKVHPLLEMVARKIAELRPEGFDESKARIYEGLVFIYRDAMARLAMAEGRKEDALAVEHTILTNPKNVASARSIEEHRTMAFGLWKDLGRSEDAFQAWLLDRSGMR